LSSDERRRHAPFLTVLGTHCINRSFPLPPQRMPASPAAASAAPGPAQHAHPATSKRPRNQTPHVHAARCVGVPAAALCLSASYAGRGDTLEEPSCLSANRDLLYGRVKGEGEVLQDVSGSGDQNQVFMIKIWVFDDHIRASQGLSTAVLLWCFGALCSW